MARIISNENESVLKRNLSNRIKSRLGESNTSQDSTSNLIGDAVGSELVSMRREISQVYNSIQVSNASGLDLDSLAFNMYGISRKPATFAFSDSRERNVYFYTTTGSFGTINSGNSISIPAGTLISTEIVNSTNSIVYRLVTDTILNANDRISYCNVEAFNVGSSYNVDSDSLIYHNYTNYTESINGFLKISNTFPIVSGSDIESDDSLRFRISNYLQAKVNLNIDAITLKALELPGVLDLEVIPSYYGIGTTGVVLFGSGRESGRNINNLLEKRLNELKIPGQRIIVSNGIKVYFDFNIRVFVKAGISEIEKIRAKENARRFIIKTIKEKEFTKTISFIEISSIIKREFKDSNIVGFGNSNSNLFENIYIRKTDREGFLPEEKQELLSTSYTVRREERISFGILEITVEEQLV